MAPGGLWMTLLHPAASSNCSTASAGWLLPSTQGGVRRVPYTACVPE